SSSGWLDLRAGESAPLHRGRLARRDPEQWIAPRLDRRSFAWTSLDRSSRCQVESEARLLRGHPPELEPCSALPGGRWVHAVPVAGSHRLGEIHAVQRLDREERPASRYLPEERDLRLAPATTQLQPVGHQDLRVTSDPEAPPLLGRELEPENGELAREELGGNTRLSFTSPRPRGRSSGPR